MVFQNESDGLKFELSVSYFASWRAFASLRETVSRKDAKTAKTQSHRSSSPAIMFKLLKVAIASAKSPPSISFGYAEKIGKHGPRA